VIHPRWQLSHKKMPSAVPGHTSARCVSRVDYIASRCDLERVMVGMLVFAKSRPEHFCTRCAGCWCKSAVCLPAATWVNRLRGHPESPAANRGQCFG
jgi:hypothetical protein